MKKLLYSLQSRVPIDMKIQPFKFDILDDSGRYRLIRTVPIDMRIWNASIMNAAKKYRFSGDDAIKYSDAFYIDSKDGKDSFVLLNRFMAKDILNIASKHIAPDFREFSILSHEIDKIVYYKHADKGQMSDVHIHGVCHYIL